MKVAFRYANASFFGRLISFWTRSKYQHSEIVFECDPEGPICFSSSEEDGGTRFKIIVDIYNTNNWDVVPISIPIGLETYLYQWTKDNLLLTKDGKRIEYNWIDIASFLFHNIDPETDKAWICSAVCLRVLQQGGFYKEIRCTDCSPELLHELILSWNEMAKNAGNKTIGTS